MYLISDFVYIIIYYCIGYRKEVVLNNLLIAFPEKSLKERIKIAKEFYRNFTDSFIETIKLFSASDKEFDERYSTNNHMLDQFLEVGKDVQLLAGHFFNWEYLNLGEARIGKYPFAGVYMPIANKIFDRIILKLRKRYGSLLIPAGDFRTKFKEYVTGRYTIALASDQNPGNPANAHWVMFFNRLTPFIKGPEKGAKKDNLVVAFAHFYKIKRGYYHTEIEMVTTTPREFEEGQLTQLFATYVEKAIQLKPANYLWSHRRWRWSYEEKYAELVVK